MCTVKKWKKFEKKSKKFKSICSFDLPRLLINMQLTMILAHIYGAIVHPFHLWRLYLPTIEFKVCKTIENYKIKI